MKFEERRIDGQEMKPYKGYGIDKSWEMVGNKRVPDSVRYMVIDQDDDWIGDVYTTLAEAKAYIDEITAKTAIKANTQVGSYKGISYGCEDDHNQRYYFRTREGDFVYAETEEEVLAKIDQYLENGYVSAASKKQQGTVRAWVEFQKWYDGLTPEQRDKVDDIADEEGLPNYEECSDDMFAWLKDEAEIVFKDVDTYDEMPDELADRPYIFNISSTNSTYNDDILRLIEEYDGIGVTYDMLNDEGTHLYANRFYSYAVSSKEDAESIFTDLKKSKIPLRNYAKAISVKKIDWNRCYNIYIDDYVEGDKKLPWHSKFNKVKSSTSIKAGMGVGERVVYHLVDYPDTDPIYNLDTGRPYCFDSEEKAQAFIDENSEYWHEKYPGIRPRSKRIYNVWHD